MLHTADQWGRCYGTLCEVFAVCVRMAVVPTPRSMSRESVSTINVKMLDLITSEIFTQILDSHKEISLCFSGSEHRETRYVTGTVDISPITDPRYKTDPWSRNMSLD